MVAVMTAATFSPVAIQMQEAYKLSSITIVNLCSISISLLTLPGTFISIWAFTHFSMSTVLRLASFAQLVGMLIRDLTFITGTFEPLIFGVLVQAFTTTFFANT